MNSPEAESAPRSVRVWDLPTRSFHWSLAALTAFALVTGFVLPQWWMGLHMAVGLGIVALLGFRVVWAFWGSEYSRLTAFTHHPSTLLAYLRGLFFLRPPHHLGHNPVGALMVFALFAVLTALTVTGLIELGGEEKVGPLGRVIPYAVGGAVKPWHSLLAWVAFAMIALHIAGVTVTSHLFGEGLVRSMIHGDKRMPPGEPVPQTRQARPLRAATVLAAVAALVTLAWWGLSALPERGWRAVALPPEYRESCGACHTAHHPSLLPRAAWQGILAGLDEHFGEDASLPPARLAAVSAFLTANAAETFDTEAAVRFRPRAAGDPLRITSNRYWMRKHASVAPALFRQSNVGGKANCAACHEDAESGRFDDHRIHIPEAPR